MAKQDKCTVGKPPQILGYNTTTQERNTEQNKTELNRTKIATPPQTTTTNNSSVVSTVPYQPF
jgi:hypothetical protein